ncbi:MAG: hypothetical protein RDU25_01090 [Patescibacteria group bacterium]|nr:hypothetical protein [Patescibacteria group bacterium]
MPTKITCTACQGSGGLCAKHQVDRSETGNPIAYAACCVACMSCYGWGQIWRFTDKERADWLKVCQNVSSLRGEVSRHEEDSLAVVKFWGRYIGANERDMGRLRLIHAYLHSVLKASGSRLSCDCSQHRAYILKELLRLFSEFEELRVYNNAHGHGLGTHTLDFIKLSELAAEAIILPKPDPFEIIFGNKF